MDRSENIGLGVPEEYFSNLKDEIFRNIEVLEMEKQLEKLCSKNTGFKTPENFEKTNSETLQKISLESKFSNKTILFWVGSIAAAVIISFFILPLSEGEKMATLVEKTLLTEVEINEILLDELSIEQLAELAIEDDNSMKLDDSSIEFILEDDDLIEELNSIYLDI